MHRMTVEGSKLAFWKEVHNSEPLLPKLAQILCSLSDLEVSKATLFSLSSHKLWGSPLTGLVCIPQ